MTKEHLDTGPSSIRDDSIREPSLNPNKSSGDIVELKPCPFCGEAAEFERKGTARHSCIVVCTNCGCRLESGEVFNCGNRWNTRAPDPESAAEIERLRREKEDDHRRIKSLSEALLAARPLGGSELFVRWGDKYHADPAFFKDALERDRARYHETMKRAVIAEKKLATAESAVAAAWEEAEDAVRKCASLDENGYICEKSAAIKSIRASAIRAASSEKTGEV